MGRDSVSQGCELLEHGFLLADNLQVSDRLVHDVHLALEDRLFYLLDAEWQCAQVHAAHGRDLVFSLVHVVVAGGFVGQRLAREGLVRVDEGGGLHEGWLLKLDLLGLRREEVAGIALRTEVSSVEFFFGSN